MIVPADLWMVRAMVIYSCSLFVSLAITLGNHYALLIYQILLEHIDDILASHSTLWIVFVEVDML